MAERVPALTGMSLCGRGAEMTEVTISASQSGSSVQVRVGDEIVVSLDENPTTGYRWAIDSSGEPTLAPIGSSYEPSAGGGMGGGGQRTFRFRAVAAGQAGLRLVLRQEWQPDTATEQFEIQTDVEP
jgi:inhibitor of cysteine peptidase